MASQALKLPIGTWVIVFAFVASGSLHLVSPESFMWLMPPWLPFSIELVILSGVAEIVSAVGLILKAKRAPLFTFMVLLAVWPANWWFAIESLSSDDFWLAFAAWARLPLQIPLLLWAWRSPINS